MSRDKNEKLKLKSGYYFFIGIIALTAVALTAASLAYWTVNFNRAVCETELIRQKLNMSPDAVLNFFKRIGIPEDYYDLLYQFSQDASTITPLILLMFFFFISRTSILLMLGKITSCSAIRQMNHMPFPKNYRNTWIQLGLLGTLYAFLLIGYSMREGIEADSTTILVTAFGTALLSTFTGVAMSFIAAPLVTTTARTLLQKPDSALQNPLPPSDKRLSSSLTEVQMYVDEFSDSLKNTNTEVNAIADSLGNFKEQLNKMDLAGYFAELGKSIKEGLASQEVILAELNEKMEKTADKMEETNGLLVKLVDSNREAVNETKALSNIMKELSKYMKDANKELSGSLIGFAGLLQKVQADVKKGDATLKVKMDELNDTANKGWAKFVRLEKRNDALNDRLEGLQFKLQQIYEEQEKKYEKLEKTFTDNARRQGQSFDQFEKALNRALKFSDNGGKTIKVWASSMAENGKPSLRRRILKMFSRRV